MVEQSLDIIQRGEVWERGREAIAEELRSYEEWSTAQIWRGGTIYPAEQERSRK